MRMGLSHATFVGSTTLATSVVNLPQKSWFNAWTGTKSQSKHDSGIYSGPFFKIVK